MNRFEYPEYLRDLKVLQRYNYNDIGLRHEIMFIDNELREFICDNANIERGFTRVGNYKCEYCDEVLLIDESPEEHAEYCWDLDDLIMEANGDIIA